MPGADRSPHSPDSQGAKDFVTLRTVLATVRKQGWNLLETLQEMPDALIRKLRMACPPGELPHRIIWNTLHNELSPLEAAIAQEISLLP